MRFFFVDHFFGSGWVTLFFVVVVVLMHHKSCIKNTCLKCMYTQKNLFHKNCHHRMNGIFFLFTLVLPMFFFFNKRVQQYNGQINYTQMITICGKTLRDQGS